LNRALKREFELVTSTLTIDEIAFISLRAKLEEKHGIDKGALRYLKRNPEIVSNLALEVNQIIDSVVSLTTLVEVKDTDIDYMKKAMLAYGLLPRDSLHLAVAHRVGISDFATNDTDFERVRGIRLFRPREKREQGDR
jgi:predicted nucleic acid-binding protein